MFHGICGFDMTAQLQTLGQAMGLSLIEVLRYCLGEQPDIAGNAIASYGQLFAIHWFIMGITFMVSWRNSWQELIIGVGTPCY